MTATTLLVWGDVTGVGGTESRMAEVIAHWRREGRRIVSLVLANEDESRFRRLLDASGCSEVHVGASLPKLAGVVRRERPGLLVAFGLRASLLVRTARVVGRIGDRPWPHTVDARNGLEMTRHRLLWKVDRRTQRLVDTYLANSEAAAATLAHHGLASNRVRVLHSALGDEWQAAGAASVPEPRSIVMVGNARPEKQQWLGLEVFAQLSTPANLTVFTDDATELRERWRQLASTALGQVRFREGHAVTPQDLDRAAIVLHPSGSESAPRCLMEGRARGCYVVAFDVGDTRRIVADGGAAVAAEDRDALLAALESALQLSIEGRLPRRRSRYLSVPQYAAALTALGGQP